MHQLLTSIVLCLVAHTATAQGAIGATPVADQVHSATALIQTSAKTGAAPSPSPAAGDLIKTAAAAPRDVAMRPSQPVSGPPKSQAVDEEDEPRRTGPAMLIAALAVMTAIALRRSGGSGQ